MVMLHVQQTLEDALGFYYVRVLNMARFSMQGLRRVLNMSENGSIITEYASICLNVPTYS